MIDRCKKYIAEAKPCAKSLTPRDLKDTRSYFGDTFNGGQLHNFPEFDVLNDAISKHVKLYFADATEDFLRDLNIYAQKSWFVRVKSGGSVGMHSHPNGHVSCVFYIDVPDKCGKLCFSAPENCVTNLPIPMGYDDYEIVPQNGMLILFPSSLEHYVLNSMPDIPRYSVSYDLICATPLPEENYCLDPSNWKKLK